MSIQNSLEKVIRFMYLDADSPIAVAANTVVERLPLKEGLAAKVFLYGKELCSIHYYSRLSDFGAPETRIGIYIEDLSRFIHLGKYSSLVTTRLIQILNSFQEGYKVSRKGDTFLISHNGKVFKSFSGSHPAIIHLIRK